MAVNFNSDYLYASIDMGTNTFKLLIVNFNPTNFKFTTIFTQSCAVALGRNSSPLISNDSQLRAIEAIMSFKPIIRAHNVKKIRVVGTSAIREAINQGLFVDEVRERLGFDVEVDVLSGFAEGRLVYYGVVQFLSVCDKRVLGVDIGGGSTEFVVGERGRVVYGESLRLGHLALSEQFGESDLIGLREYVRGQIQESRVVVSVRELGFEVVVGSSGTIRAIEKAIWCGFGGDDGTRKGLRVRWEGLRRQWWWFSREELRGFVEGLCRVGVNERDEFFSRRSEFIVAGAILLEEIMELFGISEMKVSGYALGEGVVAEMMLKDFPQYELNGNVRWKSVMRLAMRFNGNDRMRNAAQCCAIAKDVYDGLRKSNKVVEGRHSVDISLNDKDLEYLEATCMLHNIGLYFGKKGYHKRSYSIIMEHSQLDGFTSEEIELIGQLVRHHKKKFPKFERTAPSWFSIQKFGMICCILRISIIIQKDKLLKVREIKFDDSSGEIILALVSKGEQPILLDSDMLLAKKTEAKIGKEAEFFEEVFHQKLLVVVLMDCLKT